MAQQLILDIVINLNSGESIDLNSLKSLANEMTSQPLAEENFDAVRDELKRRCLVELMGSPSNVEEPKPATTLSDKASQEAKS